jgi:hypothetical protein
MSVISGAEQVKSFVWKCYGTGVWDWGEPEIPAFTCVNCKGTGRQFVSI